MSGKNKITRRMQREIAFKMLFEMETKNEFSMDFIDEYCDLNEIEKEKIDYSVLVIIKYLENREKIEKLLIDNIQNWTVERIGKVERNLIRLSTTEILAIPDVPIKVSVNEAVELTKVFAGEKSFKFVNKVMTNILESIEVSRL